MNASGSTTSAPARSWTREAKAASISLSVPAFRTASFTPFARAASCTSLLMRSAFGLFGFHQQSDHAGLGNHLGKELEQLGHQRDADVAEAREVAGRRDWRRGRSRPGRRR